MRVMDFIFCGKESVQMIIVHISATRKNIRWMLKTVNKVKKIIDVVDISEIITNKKNPKFCTVTIRFYRKDKAHQARARLMMK